jgi:hypothetical protein
MNLKNICLINIFIFFIIFHLTACVTTNAKQQLKTLQQKKMPFTNSDNNILKKKMTRSKK